MIEVTVSAGAGKIDTRRLDDGVTADVDNHNNNLIIRDSHGKFLAIFRNWEAAQLLPGGPTRPGDTV